MRPWWVLIVFTPLAAGFQVLQDEPGDLEYRPVGPIGSGTPWQPADLLALDIEETASELRFVLAVLPPADPDARSLQDSIEWVIRFRLGAVAYEIRAVEQPILGSDEWISATLYRYSGPGDTSPDRVTGLEAEYNPHAGQIAVSVLRADLRDEADTEPTASSRLANVFVESRGAFYVVNINGVPAATPYDRMPDRGDDAYEVLLGAAQTGDVRLATKERVRASNGVGTTYFFDVNVTNLAMYQDTFDLRMSAAPEPWSVRIPYDTITVPGNDTVRFPLLVTVPFAHQHGLLQTFLLEATSRTDAGSVGRLEIGVEYLATPQPAGHHDTAFLHGNGVAGNTLDTPFFYVSTARTLGWMNTRPDDPRASEAATPAYRQSDGNIMDERYGWVFPLDPALRLGLDFDLGRTGVIEGTLQTGLPVTDAWLDGRILGVPRGDVVPNPSAYDSLAGARVFAEIAPTNVGDVDESTAFSAAIVPTAEGDLVPPARDENLLLVLWLHGQRAPVPAGDQSAVALQPGTWMRLPLNEFHDPIDEAFAAPDFIHVQARGPVERFVAPGGTVLYELILTNDGAKDGTFEASVYGTNADWASFPAGRTFAAPAEGSVTIPIAVRAPADARVGDAADIVIEAVAREDERMRGLLRISAIVDPERAVADDVDDAPTVAAIEESQQKDTPTLPAPWLLAVAALAAFAARRRLV
jgi:hypothetical protein